MDVKNIIAPKREIKPTIYAYTTPSNTEKNGWIKIGYTNRDADTRIKEQTHTAGLRAEKLWEYEARFNGGGYFKDHDFHTFIEKQGVENEKGTEWYYFDGHPEKAKELFRDFAFRDYSGFQQGRNYSYTLRSEQEEAVQKTLAYAKEHPDGEFLWNAKPRFGKTLSSYDLAQRLGAVSVLVVTNRPAIANSWYDDFEKFIAWQTDYKFVSESDSLKARSPLTRKEFNTYAFDNASARQICFLSLQDLKGSLYFGGSHDKLEWVAGLNWDLLIIDEAHEGVDTFKTDMAFDNIKRKFTLHLSGTPFKAISSGKFNEEQIFNWSYEDEQEAKVSWNQESNNPYEELPQLNMFTYQMSHMITDEINQGALIDGEERDYTFDLNEFFTTKSNGEFVHEEDIIKWLDNLTRNEKYPFSTSELRKELEHTFWILERVASVKALAKLLDRHPVFKDYRVIIAAGDGKPEEEDISVNEKSLKRVKDAIKEYDKTITLSVGQLSTGVTIPEWTAVLMLSNMQSAAKYMQSAFRAQNPHVWVEKIDEQETVFQKKNAYVFDFAPERTLTIFDEFANNLSTKTSDGAGTSKDREENIKRLLNFFPVIGEDADGVMKELNFKDVLTIPRKIKATEVVRRGFMSNLLFANISGIFAAPQVVLDTLGELKPEAQGKLRNLEEVDRKDVQVDNEGEVLVNQEAVINTSKAILGDKIKEIVPDIPVDIQDRPIKELVTKMTKAVIDSMPLDEIMTETKEVTKSTKKEIDRARKDIEKELSYEIEKHVTQTKIEQHKADREYEERVAKAQSETEIEEINKEHKSASDDIFSSFKEDLETKSKETTAKAHKDFVERQEKKEANNKKASVEEDVRSRLRGFARTIPSFIMAYGYDDLTLANFDTYVPADVFKEVTGITIEQFKFLRDGGTYEENGVTKYYKGHLFDEVVFNESIQEFLKKKTELSDYFEDNEEDIFDYIPPQETNQIYTPKRVVKMMVDELEKENPGIYDDSSKTFIDLYMKSGLYITEIVKRLYNSEVIKAEFSDDYERLQHIMENQVYGLAPTEIIYRIATNFIFGEPTEGIDQKNFVQLDSTPYAKEGTLEEKLDEVFE